MPQDNPFFRRFSTTRQGPPAWQRWLGAALGLIALAVIVYNIPFVHSRLAWRIDAVRGQISNFLHPPEEAVFVPGENALTVASATAAAMTPRATATPQAATPTASATPLPIPPAASLDGFRYIDQHGGWNLCGPATLAMALTYWDWNGTRNDVEDYVKPGVQSAGLDRVERGRPDKNVMPYELEDFVDSQVPGLEAATRVGGEMHLLKYLIANGFPVIVEKGYSEVDASGKLSWLGHYLFVTGYDDTQEHFIVQDVYLRTGEDGTGKNLTSSYEEFQDQWRAFDYLFIVIYPAERQDEVVGLLGPWAEDDWANQHALEIAQAEVESETGFEQYFAMFNVGTSYVRLFQYPEAALAYDQAFALYEQLPTEDAQRPYRMLWYQTGPYWAYYYSQRYTDVINLADYTLYETGTEPTLEESLYWRGLAGYALGQADSAIADLREAVRINPNFWAAIQQLNQWGVSP